ncbi:MAG: MoaD/ThiS family protein [Saprospiraceae bacterium]|nr:MoaD/ThiS family protein [Saprospiraceae bacterium]
MKILAFGKIADILRRPEQDIQGPETVAELRIFLEQEYPELKTLRYVIAVDKQIADEEASLSENAEVALLPPFSGG